MEVLPPGEYKTSQKDLPLIDSKSNVKGQRYNHFELDNEITKFGFEDDVLMVSEELNEFRRYHALKTLIGENISNETMITKHFKVALQDLPNEHLYIATFDNNYDIQKIHNISIGGVSSTIAEPMGVLNHLYAKNTKGFFIVHNHPGGFPDPSEADISTTQRFVELAEITNKKLSEHYIVAGVGSTKISEEYPFDYDFKSIKQNARKMIAERNAKDVMTINKRLKNAQDHVRNYKGEQLTLDFKNEPER
jgi:DNA repair protein RadC